VVGGWEEGGFGGAGEFWRVGSIGCSGGGRGGELREDVGEGDIQQVGRCGD